MKKFLLAAAALVAFAAPAQARPQWIRVSADGTVFANYNTVRGTGSIRSVDVGFIISENERVANTTHIDCSSWRSSFTYMGRTEPWTSIGPGSTMESVAELVCPGDATPATPSTYGL